MIRNRILAPALAGCAMLALAGSAFAQSAVVASTDLNVRAGPGPQYPVVGVIGAGQQAELRGCLQGSKWCSVTTSGGEGWAYSDYLSGDFGGTTVVLTDRPADSGVAVVDAPRVDESTTGSVSGGVAGGVTGAVAGALIGGPVGAAVGGTAGAIAGGAVGQTIDPPQPVRTYVTEHTVDPVYLEGEVVVGARLPENVALYEVPDYEYRYVYLNGQPVLVDSGSREIVYVMR